MNKEAAINAMEQGGYKVAHELFEAGKVILVRKTENIKP